MSNPIELKCSPRQLAIHIEDCIRAGLVPFVRSSPGMGKSAIMKQVFQKNRLKMIDHRLSTSAPEDLTGLPRFTQDGRAEFAPFTELFPIEGMEVPEDYDGWGIFLDEFNSAEEQVQAAAYKTILDRMTGQKKLHQYSVITAAGNLDTDRAMTNPIGTALQSRVVHLELELNFNHWRDDVAIPEGYHPIILAFLSQYEKYLMDFRPDHNDKTFCCPRTWEFVNRLVQVKGGEFRKADAALYAGTITSGVAAQLISYAQIKDEILTYEDVMRDPIGANIPERTDAQWIISTLLADKANPENFDALTTFMDKMPMTNRVLFFRSSLKRNPNLRSHPGFARSALVLNQYLN